MMSNFEVHFGDNGTPIKTWTKGVQIEDQALQQLKNVSTLRQVLNVKG